MTLLPTKSKVFIRLMQVALLCSLYGCMFPLPYHRISEGQELGMDSLSWLQIGKTTRLQIVQELGEPNIDFVDRHTVAYSWAGSDGQVVFIVPNGGFANAIMSRYALMMRFDTEDRLEAFSTISRPTESIAYDVHPYSFDAEYDHWRRLLNRWQSRQ